MYEPYEPKSGASSHEQKHIERLSSQDLSVLWESQRCPVQSGRCALQRSSSPQLSRIVVLAIRVTRTWASLYEALEDGQIDAARLREVFVDFAPLPQAGEFVFLGVDTSNLYRPEAETAEDRTLVPMANLPKNSHAASPGWVMSHVVLLPTQAGQGTYVLDTVRVRSTEQATEVAARQLHAVVALLVARGLHPIIIGDRRSRLRAVSGTAG